MSTEKRDQLRREDCRKAVLNHYYDRSSVAQNAATAHRHLRREYDFESEEVETACGFLVGLKYLEMIPDPLGSTKYFRITSEGTIAYERSVV